MCYAHSLKEQPTESWEPLEVHLGLVAEGNVELDGAARMAAVFGAADWGRLLGRWHDLGKYSHEFQHYLKSVGGAHPKGDSRPERIDHSTAGAQHAWKLLRGVPGRILAYCIAGHHGGLPDNEDMHGGAAGLNQRLAKKVADYSCAPSEILDQQRPEAPPFDWDRNDLARAAFQLSVFCRMLFSCLVDADYLATEAFMQPQRAFDRTRRLPTLAELAPRLDAHLARLTNGADDTQVNRNRAAVLAQCRAKADLPPGLFSLTVPTGGGKTLSSLAFALRHSARHDLRRVIYAIPFTSIVEQNAKVFRQALGTGSQDSVLEHHSNFDPAETFSDDAALEAQTPWYRLASENWDAPLVVTTNVQLFESLFANKPARCRKLHRIARSVIILDECQTLPVTLLEPTLRMLSELCRNYGCTVVLCSATQPAVQHREDFRIGLRDVREIIDEPDVLYEALRRVDVTQLGKLDDDALVARLGEHEQVLCVVNTRAHAARLFTALRESSGAADGVFHLSAQMCAAHRTLVLDRIRTRLDPRRPKPCRVISTQLIEAGVDVDFPVAYRAMTGLDSIAQAAGRCNREGRRHRGRVYVFETDVKPTHDVKRAAQLAAEVAGEHDDPLSLSAIEQFFRLNYWSRNGEWDKEEVMGCFAMSGGGPHFQFREAAEKYRLIRDVQLPVIVPYGRRGRELVEQLRRMSEPPGRDFDRRAQRFAVGLYDRQFTHLRENHAVVQYHERFWVLENAAAYDDDLGLRTDAAGFDPTQLLI